MHITSGKHKNRPLQSPKGLQTRPTSERLREALFNICQSYIEGSRFLDLFAGSGAVGLEAISRGASSATLVDNSKESIRCMQANVKLLKEEQNVDIIYGDVFNILKTVAGKGFQFDIIYADPPYATKRDKEPDSLNLLKMIDEMIGAGIDVLAPGGVLFIEDSEDALNIAEMPTHLFLKNSRRLGRSALHYYIRLPEGTADRFLR